MITAKDAFLKTNANGNNTHYLSLKYGAEKGIKKIEEIKAKIYQQIKIERFCYMFPISIPSTFKDFTFLIGTKAENSPVDKMEFSQAFLKAVKNILPLLAILSKI